MLVCIKVCVGQPVKIMWLFRYQQFMSFRTLNLRHILLNYIQYYLPNQNCYISSLYIALDFTTPKIREKMGRSGLTYILPQTYKTGSQSLSCVQLFATPWTLAHQAPLTMGILLPRQEYWSGLPCPPPRDLPNPGIKPRSPALQVNSFLSEPHVRQITSKNLLYSAGNSA